MVLRYARFLDTAWSLTLVWSLHSGNNSFLNVVKRRDLWRAVQANVLQDKSRRSERKGRAPGSQGDVTHFCYIFCQGLRLDFGDTVGRGHSGARQRVFIWSVACSVRRVVPLPMHVITVVHPYINMLPWVATAKWDIPSGGKDVKERNGELYRPYNYSANTSTAWRMKSEREKQGE